MGWIIGLILGEHSYRINGVSYEVTSRFEDSQNGHSVRKSFQNLLSGNMVDLQDCLPGDNMSPEYVCSAAGKED